MSYYTSKQLKIFTTPDPMMAQSIYLFAVCALGCSEHEERHVITRVGGNSKVMAVFRVIRFMSHHIKCTSKCAVSPQSPLPHKLIFHLNIIRNLSITGKFLTFCISFFFNNSVLK